MSEQAFLPNPGDTVRVVEINPEDIIPNHVLGEVVCCKGAASVGNWIYLMGDRPGGGTYCRVELVTPGLSTIEKRASEGSVAENITEAATEALTVTTFPVAAYCTCGVQLMGRFVAGTRCGECQLEQSRWDQPSQTVGYEPNEPEQAKPEAAHVWPQAWATPTYES